MNRSLSKEEINTIIEGLFGDTFTFRKGHIGQWKDYFDDQLKELFKQYGGDVLINLGYENDYCW